MHLPILHSISNRHLSPSKAERNMLGNEVGDSDGDTDGRKLGTVDSVGKLDGTKNGVDGGVEVYMGL